MANGKGAIEAGSTLKGAGSGAAIGASIGTAAGVGIFSVPAAAIGAAAGAVIGGTVGFFKGKKTAKIQGEKQALLNERQNAEKNYYDTEYNKNILDTSYGKAVQTELENRVKESNKQMASSAAITGASDESKIAAKAGMEKNLADTYTNVAAVGDQRKQGIRNQMLGLQNQVYDPQQNDIWNQQQSYLNNAEANMGTAAKDVAGAFYGGTKPGAYSSIFNNDTTLNPATPGNNYGDGTKINLIDTNQAQS